MAFFMVLVFASYNVSFWWPLLNEFVAQTVKDKLSCKEAKWSDFLELKLIKCHNDKKNIQVDKITFAVQSGFLQLEGVEFSPASSTAKASLKFPSVPSFIKEVQITGLKIQVSDELQSAIPEKLDYIHLKRASSFPQDVWHINSFSSDNFSLHGQLGRKSDLELVLHEYPFKFAKLKALVDGKIKITQHEPEFLFVRLNNVQLLQASLNGKTLPSNKLNGKFIIDTKTHSISSFKEVDLEFAGLKIVSDQQNPHKLKLKAITLKKLRELILLFFDSNSLKKLTFQDGTLSAELELKPKIDSLTLFINSASLNWQQSYNRHLSLSALNGHITLDPFAMLKNKAELSSLSSKRSFNELKQSLVKMGLSDFHFTLGNNQLADTGLLDVMQKMAVLQGNLHGSLSLRAANQPLVGDFQIQNLCIDLQKSKANKSLALSQPNTGRNTNNNIQIFSEQTDAHSLLCDGKGQLKLLNENAVLTLQLQHHSPSADKTEELKIQTNLIWWPQITANLLALMPSLTIESQDPLNDRFTAEGHLSDLKLSAKFSANKLTVDDLKGKLDHLVLSPPPEEGHQNIVISDGKFWLDENGNFHLDKLSLNSPGENIELSLHLPALGAKGLQSVENIQLRLKGKSSLDHLNDLILAANPNMKLLNSEKHSLKGLLDYEIEASPQEVKQFRVSFADVSLNYQNNNLLSGLNGQLKLNGKDRLKLEEIEGIFNHENKFLISANFPNPLKALKDKQVDKLLSQSQFNLNVLINPRNISSFLQENKLINKSGINFAEDIYIPISLNLYSDNFNSVDFQFSSNFHKMQLHNKTIHWEPQLGKIETLTGNGSINPQDLSFEFKDIFYSGKDFGVIVNAEGKPKVFDFSIESSPLLDLSEIAKLWSDEYANGQFRSKIVAKGFEPNDKSTWIKNLEAEMYSEEDVHDIEYGILYGKHFRFNFQTIDGNGQALLFTRKGKIKNLQITNLQSDIEIQDASIALLKNCSLETADGQAHLNGAINLHNGEAEFKGAMEDVNIETISNNLFGNLGDYNGKGSLRYSFKGNFADLLRSAPPEQADGDFELKQGVVRQVAELSKGLNLANLIFGLPVYFSFNTIVHILQPQQDAAFHSIKGKWYFSDEFKKIFLKDTTYTGTNALHLSLNGEWDYKDKKLNFDVYGFLPKRAQRLKLEKDHLVLERSSLVDLSKRSRHFTFQVKGNIQNPNTLKDSVKNSLKFLWFPDRNQVKRRFPDVQ